MLTKHLFIPVENQKVKATLFYPNNILPKNPGVLFIHGWSTGEHNYVNRARSVAAKGAICLTISLRGHDGSDGELNEFSRADHLKDVTSAYDFLASQKEVDAKRIGVCGLSYGGYLASILTSKRNVTWLILKSAALYENENFTIPTMKVLTIDPIAFSKTGQTAKNNFALEALANFNGALLIVESENDTIVTHETTLNYLEALKDKQFTYKIMKGADHTLSTEAWKKEFIEIISNWFAEQF